MELGKNPRRLSETFSLPTDASSDEAYELLEEGENGFTDGRRRGLAYPRDRSKHLSCVNLICTFIILATLAVAINTATKLFPDWKPGWDIEVDTDDSFEDVPEGDMLGIQLHPEDHVDRTSMTTTHHWNITSAFRSPDGVKKEVYLVNGLFPGPTIECRSGDKLIIHVTNSLPAEERVSIHWHGLEMRAANHMDGAASFTQCPIPTGTTFVYEFIVAKDQSGTFWWHAHSQVQRGDGMYGGLVVHKPRSQGDDAEIYNYQDDVLVMIGDWYHRSAAEVLDWYTSARGFGNEPVPDSLLVNGAGRFICSMAVPARPVECSDTSKEQALGLLGSQSMTSTRLRIVNTGSLAGFTLQVSSAMLTPITIDGGFPISKVLSDSVGIIYPGERVDLILDWKPTSTESTQNSPELLVSLDPENFKYTNPALRQNQSFSMFSYNIGTALIEETAAVSSHFDLSTSIALTKSPLPNTADHTILLYAKTQKLSISGNHPAGYMNRTTWAPQSSPPYSLLSLPRSQWDTNQLVPYIPISRSPDSETWVDIIINNLDEGAHPFHLHGYSFYVVASYRSEHGWGSYNPFSNLGHEPDLNLVDPLRKDTVSVPRRGYVIIRFKADNEGIWMLHCHVLFHQASGMTMGIHVGSDEAHEDFDVRAKELCAKPGQ